MGFFFVMCDQLAVFDHTLHLVSQCPVSHAFTHTGHELYKAVHGSHRPGGEEVLLDALLGCLPQGQVVFTCLHTQGGKCFLPDTPCGRVDHPLNGGIIVGVLNQAQIG